MSNIKVDYRILGDVGTNCYLVVNEDNGECILIDPADCPDKIQQMIEKNNAELKAVLLTHGHL